MARLWNMINLLMVASAASGQSTATATEIPSITYCGNLATVSPIVPAIYSGYSTDHSAQCECIRSLDSWIKATNAPTRTLTRIVGTGATTFTTTISGTPSTIVSAVLTTDYATYTGNAIGGGVNDWYGSAKSPCCSSCTIAAGTVDLFYWPQATPATVTSFTSGGYTYQSPSVYIGFSSLSAYDFCGTIGQAFVNTTVTFNPDELFTVSYASSVLPVETLTLTNPTYTWTTVTTSTSYWATGSARLDYRDLERNCSTISGYTYAAGNPASARANRPDPCHPVIVLPPRVQSLNPGWTSCVPDGIGGFYDPPSALSAVAPPTETSSPPPAASTSLENPSPGSQSTPSTPTPTFTPPIDPTPASSNPPAESTPPSSPNPPAESTPPSSPNPPSESTPPSSPNPPADSTPVASNPPAQSSPAPPSNLPSSLSLSNAEASTVSPGQSTKENNDGNATPAGPDVASGSSTNGGNTVATSLSQNSGNENSKSPVDLGNGSNTAATLGDSSPSGAPIFSSVTVSIVTVVTTSGTDGGSGSKTDSSGASTGVAGSDSSDGILIATTTVVKSDAGVIMRGLTDLKSIAVTVLFAVFMQ